MVVICSLFIRFSDASFSLATQWVLPLSVLVVVGHLLPVYLIQKTIFHLSPIAVSFILLTLPVFTLVLQYLDSRVAFSMPSILAIGLIVVLLAWLAISNRRGAK